MKIFVKAKPGAKEEKVEKVSESTFIVSVTARPEKGRANEAMAKVLAEYFAVSKSQIIILSGFGSRQKIVEIRK